MTQDQLVAADTNKEHPNSLNDVFEELRIAQLEKIAAVSPLSQSNTYQNQLEEFLEREYGFRNSFEKSDSVDADNNPIPWITYPALYYLEQLDLSDCSVFEWGSGNSTLYYSNRAKSVFSVESNQDWFNHIKENSPANATVVLEPADSYADRIDSLESEFDLIIVDGDIFRRLECALNAVSKLKPGGLLVLDNSDWLQNTCKCLRDLGYEQIDFGGPGPINNYTWCTSIFFKGPIGIPNKNFRPSYLKAGHRNVRDSSLDSQQIKSRIASTPTRFDKLYWKLRTKVLPEFADVYCSQEGEDVLIRRLLKNRYYEPGYYVDVGAHHPIKFSNTYHFYLQGWKGINIDPLPGTKAIFDLERPRDVNIEVGVGKTPGNMNYYQFAEPAFNTFDQQAAENGKSRSELIGSVKIPVVPLEQILAQSLPDNQQITFMTIDVEGMERQVLESCNWDRFRPYIICIEALDDHNVLFNQHFMKSIGFVEVAKTKNSFFFCEQQFWQTVG